MYRRIMIFGRPGSGKTRFACQLAKKLKLPLHHLDKYFFISGWQLRDFHDFLKIQDKLVQEEKWIIDGNSTRSLEMRWARADLVLYFNYSRLHCLWRLLKRRLRPDHGIADRAEGCQEVLQWRLIKYMWTFSHRVDGKIVLLKEQYPKAKFIEIRSHSELHQFIRRSL